jgi:ABC-type thiamine transport system ATPase subunit
VAVPRGKHQRIFPLATSLTEPQIHKVRAHAVKHGFHDLMFACDRALAGSFRARVAIARWLKGGQATSR